MWLEQFLIYPIIFLVFCLMILYLHFKNSYKYWANKNIEYIKPIFPFGNMKELFFKKKSLGDIIRNVYNEFKSRQLPYGGIFILQKPVLLVVDPDLIKCILTTDFDSFHDRGIFMDEENDPLSGSLLSLPGLRWKTLRGNMTPAFTTLKIKMMFHTVVACTKKLEMLLNEYSLNQKTVDVKIIGSIAYGLECNSFKQPNTEFLTHGKRIFQFHFRDICLNFLADNYPNLLRYLKIAITPHEVTDFFINIAKQTINYREDNNIHKKDILDLLIRLKNKKNIPDSEQPHSDQVEDHISINGIAAQLFVFFLGGFETLSSALNFCLYEIASNPHIQIKLRKEIVDVLNNYGGKLTYEALIEMKYMKKILKETLRKYPPIPIIQRECTKDYKIPGRNYTVKKGTEVLISTLGLHYDPEYYPDPDIFNPNRFNEENTKRIQFTYLPFSEGPRICIGMRLAILQINIILATVLKQYKLTVDPRSIDGFSFDPVSVLLSPNKPFYLQFTKIEKFK